MKSYFPVLCAIGAVTAQNSACTILNRDNCFRAVFAKSAVGTSDCNSFFLATQTPCQVTSTTTVTTTPTLSTTASANAVETRTVASIVPVTLTTTSTGTETQTSTSTSTVTVTSTSTPVLDKRAINTPLLPLPLTATAAILDKRTTTACPAVNSPSATPVYASYCSGTARYSSACNCIGASRSTSTLVPVTVISTVTATAAPVFTTVATSTSTSTMTVTTPSSVVVGTQTVPATTTTVTTTTVTATVTATVVGMGSKYSQRYESTASSNCFYDFNSQSYLTYTSVSNDATNNYITGRNECAAVCTNQGSSCQQFFLTRSSDPFGNFNTYCFAVGRKFASNEISCSGYQTNTVYQAAYDRN